MNIQAMMKQAQQMQKDMMKAKEEIDATIFNSKNEFVEIEMFGNKQIKTIKLDKTKLIDNDDTEIMEDMIIVALNDTMGQIDKITEDKLGKYTKGMPGLF